MRPLGILSDRSIGFTKSLPLPPIARYNPNQSQSQSSSKANHPSLTSRSPNSRILHEYTQFARIYARIKRALRKFVFDQGKAAHLHRPFEAPRPAIIDRSGAMTFGRSEIPRCVSPQRQYESFLHTIGTVILVSG